MAGYTKYKKKRKIGNGLRSPLNPNSKRVGQYFTMPRRIVGWLNEQPHSKSDIIIHALRKTYNLDEILFKDIDLPDDHV